MRQFGPCGQPASTISAGIVRARSPFERKQCADCRPKVLAHDREGKDIGCRTGCRRFPRNRGGHRCSLCAGRGHGGRYPPGWRTEPARRRDRGTACHLRCPSHRVCQSRVYPGRDGAWEARGRGLQRSGDRGQAAGQNGRLRLGPDTGHQPVRCLQGGSPRNDGHDESPGRQHRLHILRSRRSGRPRAGELRRSQGRPGRWCWSWARAVFASMWSRPGPHERR